MICLLQAMAGLREGQGTPLLHDLWQPAELFIRSLRVGQRPENNPIAALVETWMLAVLEQSASMEGTVHA